MLPVNHPSHLFCHLCLHLRTGCGSGSNEAKGLCVIPDSIAAGSTITIAIPAKATRGGENLRNTAVVTDGGNEKMVAADSCTFTINNVSLFCYGTYHRRRPDDNTIVDAI